jgi:hypothetical protein
MRALLGIVLVVLVWAPSSFAGGPFMMVGTAEDVVKAQDYAFSKAEMDKVKLAGLDTIRLTQTWSKGETKLGPNDAIILGNAMKAAQFTGVRVILSIYPFGSSVTPLIEQDRLDFTQFAADIVKRYPLLHDIIVGNEPNLNRFWLPQFGPGGEDVAAPAYEQLLAATYDALKVVRPHSTIYGGALAPRGVDKPNTGRDTHSPTAFIGDLGAAYKASGRQIPIMDAFAFHPYPENSETGPNFPHPNSISIGLADYDKLVGLLGAAFDGTTQRGTSLPIIYDEFGIETTIPAAKASLYTGTEPATTKPVAEAVQADMYRQAMQMTFCQPTALGILLFHIQDEAALSGWQSGLYYVDGTPKTSLYPVRGDAFDVHRGIVAGCPGMQLTPKLVLSAGKPDKTGIKVVLTCSLDCNYTVALDNRPLTGKAVGKTPKTIVFKGALRAGVHRVTAQGVVPINAGPAGTASLSFRSS